MYASINIDIFKEENNSNNFQPKSIRTFYYKDTKKKKEENLSQFFNFAFFQISFLN